MTSNLPGAGHVRKLRGKAAREDALGAQDQAGQAFYRMDRAQRDLRGLVDSVSAHGPDAAAARRLALAFDELNTDAEGRAQRYLATLDAHPLDPEAGNAAFNAASVAFRTAATDVGAMADRLEEFAEANHEHFASVTSVLNQLATHTVAAGRALEAARAGVAALTSADMAPGVAGAALAEAEAEHARLAAKAATMQAGDAAALADRITAIAQHAQALAEEAPRTRDAAVRRLVSLRTRRDAVVHRVGGIPDSLRGLRRDFTAASWADLEDAQARAEDLIGAADGELGAAARAAEEGEWDAATAAQGRAGARLDAAAALADAIPARTRELTAAKEDPAGRVADARFAVRDAQRLVMEGRTAPPQPWGSELDSLAERVAAAEDLLTGVHPNYWAFLTELRRITDATADLIRRYRAAP